MSPYGFQHSSVLADRKDFGYSLKHRPKTIENRDGLEEDLENYIIGGSLNKFTDIFRIDTL